MMAGTTTTTDVVIVPELSSESTNSTFSNSMRRDAFVNRLQTFTPPTKYFAKPIVISPIICSRFGWVNVGLDMIQCQCCNVVLCIPSSFSSQLSLQSKYNLTNQYQQKICAIGHKDSCIYRNEAQLYKDRGGEEREDHDQAKKKSMNSSSLVPLLYSEIIPKDPRELLEAPHPKQIFYVQWKKLYKSISKIQPALILELPKVEVLDLNFEIVKAADGAEGETTTGATILSDLSKWLLQRYNNNDNDDNDETTTTAAAAEDDNTNINTTNAAVVGAAAAELAAALTLFGWYLSSSSPADDDEENRDSVIRMQCPLCLSNLRVEGAVEDRNANDGNNDDAVPPRPHKRQKKSSSTACNPDHSHRHYCPYVCGFQTLDGGRRDTTAASGEEIMSNTTTTPPLWKSLALRLMLPNDGGDNNATTDVDNTKKNTSSTTTTITTADVTTTKKMSGEDILGVDTNTANANANTTTVEDEYLNISSILRSSVAPRFRLRK